MCKLKSSLILKDQIFIPDYDSHSQMLDELGIKDTEKNAETKFIRAELYPKDGDIFSSVEKWAYKVDQDILPGWYVASYDEQRVREAVKEWADKHIHIGKKNFSVNGGTHYFKNCENVTLCGDSTATLYGNSTATLHGDSTAIAPAYSSVPKENIILSDNSTFKDCRTKTIYQSGDWKLEIVEGKKE